MSEQNPTPEQASEIAREFLRSPEARADLSRTLGSFADVIETGHSRGACEIARRALEKVVRLKGARFPEIPDWPKSRIEAIEAAPVVTDKDGKSIKRFSGPGYDGIAALSGLSEEDVLLKATLDALEGFLEPLSHWSGPIGCIAVGGSCPEKYKVDRLAAEARKFADNLRKAIPEKIAGVSPGESTESDQRVGKNIEMNPGPGDAAARVTQTPLDEHHITPNRFLKIANPPVALKPHVEAWKKSSSLKAKAVWKAPSGWGYEYRYRLCDIAESYRSKVDPYFDLHSSFNSRREESISLLIHPSDTPPKQDSSDEIQ